jgi:hypothetical protein
MVVGKRNLSELVQTPKSSHHVTLLILHVSKVFQPSTFQRFNFNLMAPLTTTSTTQQTQVRQQAQQLTMTTTTTMTANG